jgi:hypothetical protein
MSRIKAVGAAFIAVLAFGVMTASASAATAGWMVNGALLSGTQALATTAAVDKKGVINGGGLNIECEGSVLKGTNPEIISTNKGKAKALTFTVCKTTNANCTVPAEIGTVPIEAEATLEGALGVQAVFKPQTGTTFATVKFSGELCAVAGIKAITGDANTSAPTGQDERTLQLLEINVTTAQNLLFIASNAASMTGSALLKLASGAPWSFL